MSIPEGYAGSVLVIDLAKQEARVEATGAFFQAYGIQPRLWLGGDAIITKVLWKDFSGPIDALSPENEIIIATGPWTGTAAPWASRAMLGCISPETGGFGSGSFGWVFPPAMKYAGFDVIIIRGRAKKPCYVFIDDGAITFKDAGRIWGKETGETVRAVREELGERYEGEIRVLSTSVAGEHLVVYAPPCADGTSCPGRAGAGAVMGAKNLKAVAVRGTGRVPVHNAAKLLDASREAIELYFSDPGITLWQEHGATTYLLSLVDSRVSGTHVRQNALAADYPHLRNVGCMNCPAGCYHWLQVKKGPYAGTRQLGGHMTFVFSGLDNLRLDNLDALIYYERLCQELGLDPASFSQVFSWAAECFQRGFLTENETDGLTLRFGDEELVWEVMRRVAYRQGILGELLASGVAAASVKAGKSSQEMAPHVKGKPYLLKDARLQALVWALGFLTSPRGGDWLRCHNLFELTYQPHDRDTFPAYLSATCDEVYRTFMDRVDIPFELRKKMFGHPPMIDQKWVKSLNGKALLTVWSENLVGLFNSLVTCMFCATGQYLLVGVGPTIFSKILDHITGCETSYDELMRVGERLFNAQRLLNYRLKHWDRKDDRFADRSAYEPAQRGIWKGHTIPWEKLLNEYYKLRGWSDQGLPTLEKLKELGIEDMASALQE